jgi:hypothetical protein
LGVELCPFEQLLVQLLAVCLQLLNPLRISSWWEECLDLRALLRLLKALRGLGELPLTREHGLL